MIDGHHTTFEWQRYPGDICVLPVGSFEQHAGHLPLETDNVEAEFFARMIAEEVDAALLPTVQFGTCLEHSGFRGSISLRPETLMGIIRDVADEVERQGFRIMILVNGHGGNHCLVPVVRRINRMDRALKILLMHTGEFCDPEIVAEIGTRGLDIHAGEWETSIMLAIRPDPVRTPQTRSPQGSPPDWHPLRQSDLTTFGIGHFSETGAIGHPSLASAEKGQAIIDSIRERMPPHIRDRIRRLREQPRYAGKGGIAIRTMRAQDIEAGMRLKSVAGWNQTEEDWGMLLTLNPNGCFVAVHNGQVMGTVTTIRYGHALSWIGMVLVDPSFRRMGIGTRLLQKAMKSQERCETIKLDATPAGKGLYERLGFRQEYGMKRMGIHSLPALPDLSRQGTPQASASPHGTSPNVCPITDDGFPQIARLDRHAFGADRVPLLRALRARAPEAAWQRMRDGQVRGFCLGRRGTRFFQIGPLVAETVDDALELCQAALWGLVGKAVAIDVPEAQTAFLDWLEEQDLSQERPFTRMFLDSNRAPGMPEMQFAISGPELG